MAMAFDLAIDTYLKELEKIRVTLPPTDDGRMKADELLSSYRKVCHFGPTIYIYADRYTTQML